MRKQIFNMNSLSIIITSCFFSRIKGWQSNFLGVHVRCKSGMVSCFGSVVQCLGVGSGDDDNDDGRCSSNKTYNKILMHEMRLCMIFDSP